MKLEYIEVRKQYLNQTNSLIFITNFYMKGFALGLDLKQMRKAEIAMDYGNGAR